MRRFSFLSKFALWALALMLIAGAFLVAGCGDDTLSSGGDLLLQYITSTPATEMNRGSTAIVEVKVTDSDGAARSGQRVTFSVTPTSLGYFTPVSDTTDADGTVASIFMATSSGTATLQATVAGITKATNLKINESASGSGRITLEMTPLLLTANSADSAFVFVSAKQEDGSSAEDGTIIYLTAGERFEDRDHDGYWTRYVDSLMFDANANGEWDPIGAIPGTVTISNGAATAVYKAGSQATTVYLRATMIDGSDYQFAELSAKLNPNTEVASITITHNFEDLRVRGVGGVEWTVVYATAYDRFGNPVPEGIPIDFTIANGPGGGENIQGEDYGPVTVSTNSSGQASVTVYSGTVSGTIRLRASSGSIISAATQLVINAGPPAHVSVGASFCNQRSWDYVNVLNQIGANVVDIWGNPVPDSTVVWFSTEEGFVIAHALTGEGKPKGIAQTEWYSGNPRNDGIVHVYASCAGGMVGDTVAFISSGPPIYVLVTDYPSSLVANGEDKARVLVEVYDINHNFVVAGTNVAFEAQFGTISGGGTQDGCRSSVFETKYTSAVLRRDYSPVSPDDGIGAVAFVSVTAGGMGGITTGFTTLLLTTNTYVKGSAIDIEGEVEPGSTVPFSITVKDRAGNPLGGHSLTVTASMGTITGSNYVTNEYGEVNLFYTAPSIQGACIITVTDNDPRGNVSFAKKIKVKIAEL